LCIEKRLKLIRVINSLYSGFAEFQKYFHPFRASIVVCLFLAIAGQLRAQDCNPHGESLEGLPILEVTIDNGDIFDLGQEDQNLWIHKWANKLHINTQIKTIEEQLLFDPQDSYNQQLLKETERLLRSRNYIHDAKITAEEVCGKGVKLAVVTTDNWTLTPSITVSRSGGETRKAFEIEESNLLGLGTQIKFLTESDEERDSNAFVYRDNNWLGKLKKLKLELADNSDGHLYQVNMARPFIKLDSKYSWSARASSNEKENPVYEEGEEVAKVGETNDSLLLTYGWSGGLVDDSVSRYRLGWFANRLRYNTVDEPNIELPEDVDKSYPFIEYEYLNVKYVERINFQVMGITEDITLGSGLRARAGWKDEAYESNQEGHVLEFDYNFGSFISTHTLGLFDLGLRHESNKTIDDTGRIVMAGQLYNFRGVNHSYVFSSRLEAAQNPELFERIEIGGDSGLKGYPVRFQNGERAFTLSAERRMYFNVYLWQLFKFGFAMFAEAGSAWDKGENPVWLSDVGTGLRLVSTRQSSSKVLHIDIAFPLREKDEIDDYQLYVKARTEF
jgi:outer membrane protein assembly factor BamA